MMIIFKIDDVRVQNLFVWPLMLSHLALAVVDVAVSGLSGGWRKFPQLRKIETRKWIFQRPTRDPAAVWKKVQKFFIVSKSNQCEWNFKFSVEMNTKSENFTVADLTTDDCWIIIIIIILHISWRLLFSWYLMDFYAILKSASSLGGERRPREGSRKKKFHFSIQEQQELGRPK